MAEITVYLDVTEENWRCCERRFISESNLQQEPYLNHKSAHTGVATIKMNN